MLDRNTTVSYEAVCITDNPIGLDPHIRVVPLWNDLRDMGGCYVRLKAFHKSMKDIIGEKFIWFDIDCVIVGNIDHILNDPAPFKMWGDTNPRTPYNGSMCMVEAGYADRIWTEFDPKTSPRVGKRLGYVGTDQAWISVIMGPNQPRWSISDGVYSFRCHMEKLNRVELPTNARVVMFHGRFDPSQRQIQTKYPWVLQHWK